VEKIKQTILWAWFLVIAGCFLSEVYTGLHAAGDLGPSVRRTVQEWCGSPVMAAGCFGWLSFMMGHIHVGGK
jgi:hypothetical protein